MDGSNSSDNTTSEESFKDHKPTVTLQMISK